MRNVKVTSGDSRKHGRLGCLAAVLTLLLLAACNVPPGEINAEPGKEFSLATGQSASIRGENMEVRFIEVISDSRCPEGAICIWEGEASSLVEITQQGVVNREVLTQPGLSEPSGTAFQEYGISFNLKPYPEVGKEIKSEDYRLSLVVTKNP